MHPISNEIRQIMAGRTPRERVFLIGGIATATLLVVYFSWVSPTWERMALLDRLIPQKEREVMEFSRLRQRYVRLSQQIKNMEGSLAMPQRASSLSFLEEMATQHQVRKNITTLRPLPPRIDLPYREVPVEVKLENVTLSQVIPFLAAIERSPSLSRIKQLVIKTRFSDATFLDMVFVVSSYEKMAL